MQETPKREAKTRNGKQEAKQKENKHELAEFERIPFNGDVALRDHFHRQQYKTFPKKNQIFFQVGEKFPILAENFEVALEIWL